jgi:tyrosyl-tRNA synthetase
VLPGYGSCELESDLTVVGTDQLFNELMGRFLADRLGAAPQVAITTHITPAPTAGRNRASGSVTTSRSATRPGTRSARR